MKKLLLSSIATAALFGCSIDPNYLDCLYSYMRSKTFNLNGFFYQYDFNKDGFIKKSDWVYYDFATKAFYQLMGNPSQPNDVFGWKVVPTSALSDLDAENPDGIFIRIGFPQDYDTRFSWVYIPWQTSYVFKLSGQMPNGSFSYLDLDCDGNPDPLPDIGPQAASQNILLPGMEGTAQIAITFDYTGSTTLHCPAGWSGGFNSSSSSSNSWSTSWGGGFSSSSIIGGCFDLISFDKMYINKNLVEHHPLPLEYDNGVEVKDGYILGGYIQKSVQNSYEIFQNAIVTAIDRSGHLVWSRIFSPISAADSLDTAILDFIDKDKFLVNINYFKKESSYGNIIATMNRYGSSSWANLYFLNESGLDISKSGLYINDCSVVGSNYICYGNAHIAIPTERNIRSMIKVLPTPNDTSSYGGEYSSHSANGYFQTDLAYAFALDNGGNVLWSKMYTGEKPYQSNVANTEAWSFESIVSLDNALFTIGTNYNTFSGLSKKGLLLTKMNPNGELLWARTLFNHDANRLLEGWNAIAVNENIYATFTQSNGYNVKETDILVMNADGAIYGIKRFASDVQRDTSMQIFFHGGLLYADGGDAIYIMDKNLHVQGLIPANGVFFVAGEGTGYVMGLNFLMDAGSLLSRYDINGNSCKEDNHLTPKQLVDVTNQFHTFDAKRAIEFDFGMGHIPYNVFNSDDVAEGEGCTKNRGMLCIN